MNMNEIVSQLRVMASECENVYISLPLEMVEILNGKQENGWENIQANKILQYISDMLEE